MAISTPLKWMVLDSGTHPGRMNMDLDLEALNRINDGKILEPRLRFFQWDKPTVSYGHLITEKCVSEFRYQISDLNSTTRNPKSEIELVKRPTGGGAVLHQTTDLSLSLLWPRGHTIFPERPSACYKAIHENIKSALQETNPEDEFSMFNSQCSSKEKNNNSLLGSWDMRIDHFSVCFDEPVCNDIMLQNRKIVGGALRITRKAILYQGNILINDGTSVDRLKERIISVFLSTSRVSSGV